MIYIAGKYTAKGRLACEREHLRRMGFAVNSSWLDEPWRDYEAPDEVRRENALRDYHEVRSADTIILDTQDESNTGGREVELGYAWACNKTAFLVGPRCNVFHYLIPDNQCFESWEGLRAHFAELS